MQARLICLGSLVSLLALPVLLQSEALSAPDIDTIPLATTEELQAFRTEISGILNQYSGRWAIPGADGFLFMSDDLVCYTLPDSVFLAKADLIIRWKKDLDRLGIDYVYLPIPCHSAVYPDKISGGIRLRSDGLPPRVDLFFRKTIHYLREHGVNVLDVTDAFIHARLKQDSLGYTHLRQDSHWAPAGAMIAAQELAQVVRLLPNYGNTPELQGLEVSWAQESIQMGGDLFNGFVREIGGTDTAWRTLGITPEEIASPPKFYRRMVHGVSFNHETSWCDTSNRYPILLVGESNCYEGKGFPENLAHELRRMFSLQVSMGGGLTNALKGIALQSNQNPGCILGRKVFLHVHNGRSLGRTEQLQELWPVPPPLLPDIGGGVTRRYPHPNSRAPGALVPHDLRGRVMRFLPAMADITAKGVVVLAGKERKPIRIVNLPYHN